METEGPPYLGGSSDVWVRAVPALPLSDTSYKKQTGTSNQVWVFLRVSKNRFIVLPPNPVPILHLFSANRTSDVLQPQPLIQLVSKCPVPSPALVSPSPPHSFQQVHFKHSNLPQQITQGLLQPNLNWKQEEIQKIMYRPPAVPIYHPQATPSPRVSPWHHRPCLCPHSHLSSEHL